MHNPHKIPRSKDVLKHWLPGKNYVHWKMIVNSKIFVQVEIGLYLFDQDLSLFIYKKMVSVE